MLSQKCSGFFNRETWVATIVSQNYLVINYSRVPMVGIEISELADLGLFLAF